MMTDPVSDMLIRVKNASNAGHSEVLVPASNMKKEIVKILKEEGFIKGYEVLKDKKQGMLKVYLRYGRNKEKFIKGMRRVSKPGLRIYTKAKDIRLFRSGFGIAILSTPQGIKTDKEAKRLKLGGEVIAHLW